jgi:hypothetical protein
MKNTMPHDKKVEVIEISTGMFKAYLHANHVPFTVESEGGPRTEYQLRYRDHRSHELRVRGGRNSVFHRAPRRAHGGILAREAVGRAKSEAEIAQAKLDASDYAVIKAAEAFLASQGIEIPGRKRAEDLRQIIRDYRAMCNENRPVQALLRLLQVSALGTIPWQIWHAG